MIDEGHSPHGAEPDDGGEATDLKERLEEALREKDQFHLLAQRSQADLANYKRRVSDDMKRLRRSASSQVLLKILGFADDFERAMSHIPEDAAVPGWLEGLNLVHRSLQHILESEGISRIEARGQPFEPREHEAVSYEETDEVEPGKVATVIRQGYKLHDAVLRPAQVTVSKGPESTEQTESGGQEA